MQDAAHAVGDSDSDFKARSGSPPTRSSGVTYRSVREGADVVFAKPKDRVDDFAFNREVTAVFDDMVERSVPGYREIQRMTAELAADFVADGTNVYDLGCSTCTSFLQLHAAIPRSVDARFIGIDDSPDMLAEARSKLAAAGFDRTFELRHGDLHRGVDIDNASVVLLVLTLQFVRPLHRERVIRGIYEGMTDKGCLIIVEKVLGENSTFNRLFIKHYYEFKMRSGYSELEISQKREALENVLVPYRLEENRELLRTVGFSHVDVFFKWHNFCGLIAMK